MPYKLSAKQLDDIKIQLELEVPTETIAKSIPCSCRMVTEVRNNLQVWHAPKPPKLVSTGPKKLITPSIEQVSLLHSRSSELTIIIGHRGPIGSRSHIIS
jgi:hypothetical protein